MAALSDDEKKRILALNKRKCETCFKSCMAVVRVYITDPHERCGGGKDWLDTKIVGAAAMFFNRKLRTAVRTVPTG